MSDVKTVETHSVRQPSAALPVRRPEVVTLAKRLRRENPNWSEAQCIEQAKGIVISKANS